MNRKTLSQDPTQARRQPTQQRAKARVEAILAASRQLIVSEGVEQLTAIRIAQQAGLPVGSVYTYFPNHIAVIEALADQWLAGLRQGIRDLLAQKPAAEQWSQALDALVTLVYGAADQVANRRFENEMVRALDYFPELQGLRDDHAREVADLLTNLLEQGGAHWERARLNRLTRYCFELIGGLDSYLMQSDIDAAEALQWTRQVLQQLIAPVFARS